VVLTPFVASTIAGHSRSSQETVAAWCSGCGWKKQPFETISNFNGTLPLCKLVRDHFTVGRVGQKANHMDKIGRVGALPSMPGLHFLQGFRFQRASAASQPRPHKPPHRKTAAGDHPPHSPTKRHNSRPHQRTCICFYGHTLGPTVLNLPRRRKQGRPSTAASGKRGLHPTASSDTPNHLSTAAGSSSFPPRRELAA
jgi:hypothetical protein